MSKKNILIFLVIVLPLSALSWHFLIKGRLSRYQTYEGVIQKGYEVYDPAKEVSDNHRGKYLSYDHFWRIECSDGEIIDVKVPYRSWLQGDIGVAVFKESGDRFPRLRELPKNLRRNPTQARPTALPMEAPLLEANPSAAQENAAVEN